MSQRFGGIYRLYLQDLRKISAVITTSFVLVSFLAYIHAMKMEAT
jgi:hypothetical protein